MFRVLSGWFTFATSFFFLPYRFYSVFYARLRYLTMRRVNILLLESPRVRSSRTTKMIMLIGPFCHGTYIETPACYTIALVSSSDRYRLHQTYYFIYLLCLFITRICQCRHLFEGVFLNDHFMCDVSAWFCRCKPISRWVILSHLSPPSRRHFSLSSRQTVFYSSFIETEF